MRKLFEEMKVMLNEEPGMDIKTTLDYLVQLFVDNPQQFPRQKTPGESIIDGSDLIFSNFDEYLKAVEYLNSHPLIKK